MPRNQTVSIPEDEWTELTENDVTALALQVLNSTAYIRIQATTGSAPSTEDGYALRGGDSVVFDLESNFPGVANATRLWAYSTSKTAEIFVSHA